MKIITNKKVTSILTLNEEEVQNIIYGWAVNNTNLKEDKLDIEFETRQDFFDGITITQTVEETEEEDAQ